MSEENSPPYVRFETRAVDDAEASKAAGHYVSRDVDFIIIIPRGSGGKLTIDQKYDRWLQSVKSSQFRHEIRVSDASTPMASARFPDSWIKTIEEAYTAWKNGQTLPEKGIPIAQWGVPTPSQRKALTEIHILTVEQLAEATEEALSNFGMGGHKLRQLARDYLAATKNDAAKTATEMADLRRQNESLQGQLDNVLKKLEAMNAPKPATNSPGVRA